MADWLQQGRCENEMFLSALVLYLFQWIDGIDKVVERLYRRTSTAVELSSGVSRGSTEVPSEELESSWLWRIVSGLFHTVSPVLETIPLLSRLVSSQDNTEMSDGSSKVKISTIPLLDTLRTHIKHYKASLPSVLGLGDVSGNPISLDAQYLAEEMNMKSVLGNSRLLEAFPVNKGLACDWTDGALLVSAYIVRTTVWWQALQGEEIESELTTSFEEVIEGRAGDPMEVVHYLERSNLKERLEMVIAGFGGEQGGV